MQLTEAARLKHLCNGSTYELKIDFSFAPAAQGIHMRQSRSVCIVTAYVVMANIVIAYVVMAYIVMADMFVAMESSRRFSDAHA